MNFVPICFKKKTNALGIIPILNETPDQSATRSASSFIDAYPNAKIMPVHQGRKDQVLSSKIRVVGASQLV